MAKKTSGSLSAWEQQWASRPLLRGWLHAAAFPAALAATASLTLRRKKHRKAVAAYGAGLSVMFAASATYHRLTPNESWVRVTQPLDHAMIFAAIAGSATPVAAVVLPEKALRPALGGLWGAAAVGAWSRVNDLRFHRSGMSPGSVAYLTLGWSGAALLPLVVKKTGWVNGALVAVGGVSYTIGAVLFAIRKPNLFPRVFGYHELWHVATLVGAAAHLAAIANMTADEETQEENTEDPVVTSPQ
jgi:hemolysin III